MATPQFTQLLSIIPHSFSTFHPITPHYPTQLLHISPNVSPSSHTTTPHCTQCLPIIPHNYSQSSRPCCPTSTPAYWAPKGRLPETLSLLPCDGLEAYSSLEALQRIVSGKCIGCCNTSANKDNVPSIPMCRCRVQSDISGGSVYLRI